MTLKYAMRADNALVERASVAVDGDLTDVAINEPRVVEGAWASPITATRVQDTDDADYYLLDTCDVKKFALCATGGTGYGSFTKLYKTDGVADESGKYTFTKIADVDDGTFAAYTNIYSVHALDNGNWLLSADADLWLSTDAGVSWSKVITGNVLCEAFSWCGVDGAHICIGEYNNSPCIVYTSHDYGASWVEAWDDTDGAEYLSVANGATNRHIHTVIWDPTDDHNAIFVSRGDSDNSHVYRIVDNGAGYVIDPDWHFYDAGMAVASVTLTGANPVAIGTATHHKLITGSRIQFYGVAGTEELNSTSTAQKIYTVTFVSETAFTLDSTSSADFTAFDTETPAGVFRLNPVGPARELGLGQPTAAIAVGTDIYWGTEATGGPTLMKMDCVTREVTRAFNIPRTSPSLFYYMLLYAGGLIFHLRKVGGVYYMNAISDNNHDFSSIYASANMVDWVLVKRQATSHGSFFGYHQIGMLNGKLWVGVSSAADTRWTETFAAPTVSQMNGFASEESGTNLLSPGTGHTNDSGNFTTATTGWDGLTTYATIARSTDYAFKGTHSLKCTCAQYIATAYLRGPLLVATQKYAPQAGDYILVKWRVKLPYEHRHISSMFRVAYVYSGAAAAKTTVLTETAIPATKFSDGWTEITGIYGIATTWEAGDDVRPQLSWTPNVVGTILYVDACEMSVSRTRWDFTRIYSEGATSSESGLLPMAGCGRDWTATFAWKPNIGTLKNVISGNLPICQTHLVDGSTIDLYFEGDAGDDRGKWVLQRTIAGSAQTAILSTSAREIFFDEIFHIGIGTDNANSKIYAKIIAPDGTISLEDANTGCLQPTHMRFGTNGSGNGKGTFAATRCYDTEFITDATALVAAMGNIYPKIRRIASPPGMLLPI